MPVIEVEVRDHREVVQTVHEMIKRVAENAVQGRDGHHCRHEFDDLVGKGIHIILVVLITIIAKIFEIQETSRGGS